MLTLWLSVVTCSVHRGELHSHIYSSPPISSSWVLTGLLCLPARLLGVKLNTTQEPSGSLKQHTACSDGTQNPAVRRSDVVRAGGARARRLRGRLTVHGVELDAVRRGHAVRRPLDAELVVLHVVGLDVGDVQVHCGGHGDKSEASTKQACVLSR